MASRARERAPGRVRIALILGLAVAAVAVYAGGQAIFHYWAYWNLREEAQRAALEVAAREGQEGLGRQMIQAKAREYGLHFEDKDIAIVTESGNVSVAFSWEALIRLPWYTYPLTFHVSAASSRRLR